MGKKRHHDEVDEEEVDQAAKAAKEAKKTRVSDYTKLSMDSLMDRELELANEVRQRQQELSDARRIKPLLYGNNEARQMKTRRIRAEYALAEVQREIQRRFKAKEEAGEAMGGGQQSSASAHRSGKQAASSSSTAVPPQQPATSSALGLAGMFPTVDVVKPPPAPAAAPQHVAQPQFATLPQLLAQMQFAAPQLLAPQQAAAAPVAQLGYPQQLAALLSQPAASAVQLAAQPQLVAPSPLAVQQQLTTAGLQHLLVGTAAPTFAAAQPGALPGGLLGGLPGAMHGVLPGAMPSALAGGLHGSLQGMAAGAMSGTIPAMLQTVPIANASPGAFTFLPGVAGATVNVGAQVANVPAAFRG